MSEVGWYRKIGSGAGCEKLEQRLTNYGLGPNSACALVFEKNIYVLSVAAFVLQRHS